MREAAWGNAVSSMRNNKHRVTFDDSETKEVHSNSLTLEDFTASMPIAETI